MLTLIRFITKNKILYIGYRDAALYTASSRLRMRYLMIATFNPKYTRPVTVTADALQRCFLHKNNLQDVCCHSPDYTRCPGL